MNRQDACSTKTLFSCGTGILPVADNARFQPPSLRKNIFSQTKSAPISRSAFRLSQVKKLTVDRRSNQSNWCGFASGQVKWEVVSVALVHDFHTQVSAVDDISPCVDYATL